MFETQTPVHSPEESARMLRRSTQRETSAALAVSLYAQLLCMSALRLLSVSSTASWISLLLTLPAGIGIYFLSALTVRRQSVHDAERIGMRMILAAFALLFFTDMALCLFAMTELVCAYILPDAPRWLIVATTVLSVSLFMGGRAHGGAARAAYLLRGFFLLAVIVCFFFALPDGNVGFLYPLLGYGGGQTVRGAMYMTGGLWSVAALPYLAHEKGERIKRGLHTALHPLLGLLLLALILLAYAYLLPSPLLPGDWGFVLRLQLLMEMSPNTLAWSLMLISRMLLFLTGFAAAGDFSRMLLCRAFKRRRVPLWPLTLAGAPLALAGVAQAEGLLKWVLPLRFPIALILSLAALAQTFLRAPKEAA